MGSNTSRAAATRTVLDAVRGIVHALRISSRLAEQHAQVDLDLAHDQDQLGVIRQDRNRYEGYARDDSEQLIDDQQTVDQDKRDLADAKNAADGRIHQIEKMFAEAGDKITDADKAPINAAIAKVKEASGRNDLAAIKAATAELEQASQAMAQHMYSKAGAEGQGATPSQGPEGKKDGPDDVIDAEYEVKK